MLARSSGHFDACSKEEEEESRDTVFFGHAPSRAGDGVFQPIHGRMEIPANDYPNVAKCHKYDTEMPCHAAVLAPWQDQRPPLWGETRRRTCRS